MDRLAAHHIGERKVRRNRSKFKHGGFGKGHGILLWDLRVSRFFFERHGFSRAVSRPADSLKKKYRANSPTCHVAKRHQPAKYQITHFIHRGSAPPMAG